MNAAKFKTAADAVLAQTVSRHGGAPGIVAMATTLNAISTKARPAAANSASPRR